MNICLALHLTATKFWQLANHPHVLSDGPIPNLKEDFFFPNITKTASASCSCQLLGEIFSVSFIFTSSSIAFGPTSFSLWAVIFLYILFKNCKLIQSHVARKTEEENMSAPAHLKNSRWVDARALELGVQVVEVGRPGSAATRAMRVGAVLDDHSFIYVFFLSFSCFCIRRLQGVRRENFFQG